MKEKFVITFHCIDDNNIVYTQTVQTDLTRRDLTLAIQRFQIKRGYYIEKINVERQFVLDI